MMVEPTAGRETPALGPELSLSPFSILKNSRRKFTTETVTLSHSHSRYYKAPLTMVKCDSHDDHKASKHKLDSKTINFLSPFSSRALMNWGSLSDIPLTGQFVETLGEK